MIYALASILDLKTSRETEAKWAQIGECLLETGVQPTPLPHFSWHVAETYRVDEMMPPLTRLFTQINPIMVQIGGVGVFSGYRPIVYLPVIRTQEMSAFHYQLWQTVQPFCANPVPYYRPELWQPHVTLTGQQTDGDAICQIVSRLSFLSIRMSFLVDDLAMIYKDETASGTQFLMQFGAGQ